MFKHSAVECASFVALMTLGFAGASAQDLPTFRAQPAPLVSIGVEDGAEPYLLSGVTNAFRQSNGRIVVGQCDASDVRIYDSSGRHVRTVGRRGQGPGEFQGVRRVFPAGGDSIGVDHAAIGSLPGGSGGLQHRLSIFTPDGAHVRTINIPAGIEALGRLSDGTFIGRRTRQPSRTPTGIRRTTVSLFSLNDAGTPLDSISGAFGMELIMAESGPIRTVRFPRTAVAAVLGDRFAFGTQDSAMYTEFGGDLRPLRRVTTVTRPEPVTAAVIRQWEETRPVLIPRGGVVSSFGVEYASHMPAYRDIVAGSDGHVWVQDPYRPGVYPLVWTAYQNGRPVARVETPARFFVTQFGPDWVLGIAYDDLGVERVRVHRLSAGPLSDLRVPPRDAQPPDRPRCGSWVSR